MPVTSSPQPEVTPSGAPLAPGLYIVGTPIGNLEDITLRALRVLRQVDKIACEDTRQTQKLLNHFETSTPTVSMHQHNERERAVELVAAIEAGQRIALVSDAGMPGISDPGGWLIQAAVAAGLAVFPIPGPNAAISALVASGLSAADFRFLGFLPEKPGARRTQIEALFADLSGASGATAPRGAVVPPTLIFYEAPHRILDTLSDLESVGGPALRVVVARELTKIHEEFLRGTVAEVRDVLASRERIRGEITLLVEPPIGQPATSDSSMSIPARLKHLESSEGLSEKDALKRLARELGQSKSDLYRELQRERAKSSGSFRKPSS